MTPERARAWDRYPTSAGIHNPQMIPGFESWYLMRSTLCQSFRDLSDAYVAWIEDHLPDEDMFLVLSILDVHDGKSYCRRTRSGFTIGVTQPLRSYLAASTESEMMDLADRDFAVFERAIRRRWRAPAPPDVEYPAIADVEQWRRLGHLLMAGETVEPLIALWRTGNLDAD